MTAVQRIVKPTSLLVLFSLLIVASILTWVIPAGLFDRDSLPGGVDIVVAGSYQRVPQRPQLLGALLTAWVKGFVEGAQLIGFIMMLGGSFAILDRTDALKAGIGQVLALAHRQPRFKALIIPLSMVFFSLGGSLFGLSEEVIILTTLTIPFAIALGYDSIVGVAIPLVASQVGVATAFVNPFSLGIAQTIAQVPLMTGLGYRLCLWGIFTSLAIVYVMRYADTIAQDPLLSPVSAIDTMRAEPSYQVTEIPFDRTKAVILVGFGVTILLVVIGPLSWQWSLTDCLGVFWGYALVAALLKRLSWVETLQTFIEGSKQMLLSALTIALAQGVLIILREGHIIDTLLAGSFALLNSGISPALLAQVMFIGQSLVHVVVPSGSGQAALTLPLMIPLLDLMNITRQAGILIYQLGSGLNTIILPTSPLTLSVLSIAFIPFTVWARWAGPLVGLYMIGGILALMPPMLWFTYGPL